MTWALKHQMGQWLVAGAVNLGWVQADSSRLADGANSASLSTSDTYNITGRLRVAYEIPFATAYIRPYADFDVSYVNVPGYLESGTSGTELNIRGVSQTTFVFSPTLEVGTRINLPNNLVLRPYASIGASFAYSDTWVTAASIIGEPASAGTFNTITVMPGALANFDLGLQAVANEKWEFKLEYGMSAAANYLAQTGMARFAVHF